MSNFNDRRGGQDSSLLALTPVAGKRKERGSLLSFPGVAATVDAPAESRAHAHSRREPQPVRHEKPVAPVHREEVQPEPADPGFVEKLMRRPGRASSSAEPAKEKAAVAAKPDSDIENTIERVEAMLRRQQEAMSRLADEVEATTPPHRADETVAPQPVVIAAAPARIVDSGDDWKPLIDPARVIRGVVDSRNLIIGLTILGGAIGVLVALSTPKKYEATAEIVIDPRDLKIGERPLTDTNGLPSDSTIALVENQVRVLSSGTVLTKVVEQLNLESDPEFNGQGAGFDLNPINLVRGLLSRSDGAEDPARLRGVTVSNLMHQVNVFRTGRSFVVLVSAKTTSPEKSALIANKVTEVFVETSGAMQSQSAGRANAEVVGQLERLRDDLEAAEQKVEKFRAENDLVGAQGRLITDDEIVKLNEQLGSARARTIELNARAQSASNMSVDAVVGGAIPEVAASGMVTELRGQYAAAKQEADRISVRLGPRHPSYQAAQTQVATLSGQISAELRRISAQIQTDLRRSVQLEQDLAARLAQLKVRQGDVSGELVTLRELERDAQAKRSVYEGYLLRANETSEQKEINSSNVSVISAASPPLKSSGASRATVAISGALLGLLAGLAIGLLRGAIGGLRDAARRNSSEAPLDDATPAARSRLGRGGGQEPDTKIQDDEEDRVSPYYPPHGYAPYPPQNAGGQAPQPAYPYAAPNAYPQPHAGQPMPPYPQPAPNYSYPQQAYQQPWQHVPLAPQPAPAYYHPYAQPMQPQPHYPQPPAYAPAAAYPPPPAPPSDSSPNSFTEIAKSVREFRDAVRELTESRTRRRYF